MQRRTQIGLTLLMTSWLALAAPGPLGAQGPGGNPALAACEGDAEKLCADLEPGALRLLQCFKRNHEALGSDCRTALAGKRGQGAEKLRQLNEACHDDGQHWCSNARGPMHLIGCLRKHRDELSGSCRDALPERPPAAAPDPEAEPDADSAPAEPDADSAPAEPTP